MQLDPIISLRRADEDTEWFESMLCGIIRSRGLAYAASVVERYAEKYGPNRLADATGQLFATIEGKIDPQEIADYTRDVADREPTGKI